MTGVSPDIPPYLKDKTSANSTSDNASSMVGAYGCMAGVAVGTMAGYFAAS